MRDSWRHFVAEFVGTFALVFVGSGAILVSKIPGSNIGLIEIALAHGLIFAAMVTATMRISGHLNPAVTIALLAVQRIGAMMAGIYLVAQVLGAMLAAYALQALFPATLYAAARGGGPSISLDVTGAQAFGIEAITTFFLVFVVFGTAVDPRAPRIGGLAIGLTLAAGMLATYPLTGGSMNPARAFGPAVASGVYEGQLIYWIAPILGGLIAAAIYEYTLIRHPVEPVTHGAVQARSD
jgi:MIP family channel proteins